MFNAQNPFLPPKVNFFFGNLKVITIKIFILTIYFKDVGKGNYPTCCFRVLKIFSPCYGLKIQRNFFLGNVMAFGRIT